MMQELIQRGRALAVRAAQQQLLRVAAQMQRRFGDAAIEIRGSQIRIGGRGAMRRWLVDPALRFFGRGLT